MKKNKPCINVRLGGVSSSFSACTDLCILSQITGNLVKSKLKVAEQYVHVLPMNTPVTVEGVKVVLLDANQWVVSQISTCESFSSCLSLTCDPPPHNPTHHPALSNHHLQLSRRRHAALLPA